MEKFFRIGEIMEYTNLSRQTLHYYTQLRLIREVRRTASNYRLYSEDVFFRIKVIQALQSLGYTLLDIKDLFDDKQEQKILKKHGVKL